MKSNDISRRWKGNVETPLKGMSIYSYGIFIMTSLSTFLRTSYKFSPKEERVNYITNSYKYITRSQTNGGNFASLNQSRF